MLKKLKSKKSFTPIIVIAILIAIFFVIDKIEGDGDATPATKEETQKQYTFSGTSHETLKVNLNKGLAIFKLKANCNSPQSIAVDFRKGDGTYYSGHLFNELGESWNGSTSLNINSNGTYILNVKINGTWELKIE